MHFVLYTVNVYKCTVNVLEVSQCVAAVSLLGLCVVFSIFPECTSPTHRILYSLPSEVSWTSAVRVSHSTAFVDQM